MKRALALLFLSSLTWPGFSQVRINELMASNTNTLYDEDQDDPDWIELFNEGEQAVNLKGYVLSDSNNVWEFPNTTIGSKEYLLVFASGKDRNIPPLTWQTIIDIGSDWKYTVPNNTTSASWYLAGYDDSSWPSGQSGFGYGDGDDNTELPSVLSVFLRKNFQIESLNAVQKVILHMDYDDAFVAYINGVEVARANISSEGPPAYNQAADNYNHEAQIYQGNPPDEFLIDQFAEILQEGENTIAIQVHNHSTGSSDLTAIPFLSIGLTEGENQLSSYLSASQNYLHTNFELKSDGETVLLLDTENHIVDSVTFPVMDADISFGRNINNKEEWVYYEEPTPGIANNAKGFSTKAGNVNFSIPGGIYSNSLQITLESNDSSDKIYYTLDGSLPSTDGTLYSCPIIINKTTVLRAQVANQNTLNGAVNTQSYFINTTHEIPIVSLATDPHNLWDYNEGIYELGPDAEPNNPFFGANFWQDWEKPAHLEMLSSNGETLLSQDVGIKIFGGWTRAFDQKSLAVHARKSYGDDTFSHQIFSNLDINEFSSIVLRNSGNDWNLSMFRDAMLTTLFAPSIDKQAYQPAVLYLNGEFWGIQNIREKVNEDFIARHHQLDPDSITILELDGQPVEGDETAYRALISYIENNDLSVDENYQYVASQIDVENFIFYQSANIFIDNKDWPGNNIKFWKSSNTKWRWIAYDTDFGFSLFGENVNYNTLQFALDPYGPNWPNPPWSTLLLRKLIENTEFKNQFINAFCDQLNTSWEAQKIKTRIDSMAAVIESDISSHMNRWNGNVNNWYYEVTRMKEYAENRPSRIVGHLQNQFNTGNQFELKINSSENQGVIRINTLNISSYPWSGQYFSRIPVTLEAIPAPGYQFVKWSGDASGTDSQITLSIDKNMEIEAVFERMDEDSSVIVINEICNNTTEQVNTEDWVELYNNGVSSADLTGWELKDDDDTHVFTFPSVQLSAGDFLVVCRDQTAFESVQSGISSTGSFDFGLSSENDCVRLFNTTGTTVDEVCYDEESSWPLTTPESTLGLIDPNLDNSLASSWQLIGNNGSPGATNIFSDMLSTHKLLSSLIYPNPVIGKSINVQIPNIKELSVELISMDGSQIYLKQMPERTEFAVPSFIKNGVYFLKVRMGHVSYLQKVFISR